MISVELPKPPSVNAMYANVAGVGRVKTSAYRKWITSAGWALAAARQPSIAGPYAVYIAVNSQARGDIDNIIKPTLDLLVNQRLTDDDKNCRKIVVERDDDTPKTSIRLFVEAV